MNIQNEKQNEQVQELRIEICTEDYAEKVESALKKHRRTAQIPGFRVGNVPMAMIKKMYEKSLIADTVNDMMISEMYKYFSDNKIDILGEPLPVNEKTIVDFEHPEKFVFTFEIASEPEVNIDFTKLPSFTRYQITATKQNIDDYIDQQKKQFGQISDNQTVSEDDYLSLQYNLNGEQFGGCNLTDLNENGRKLFLNKNKNEVVRADLNEIFDSEERLATFLRLDDKAKLQKDTLREIDLTINFIGHLTPAEMNAEFFKKVFPDDSIETVEEFEKRVAKNIDKNWEIYGKRYFMNKAIDVLLNNVTINLPTEFLKKFILYTQKDLTPESLNEHYTDYENSFKWQLIDKKITTDGNVTVTIDEIKDYMRQFFIDNYFSQINGEGVEERINELVNSAMKNEEDVKKIHEQLFENKIIDILEQKMPTETVSVSFEEFSKITLENKEQKESEKAKKSTKKEEATDDTEAKPKAKAKAKKTDTAEKPAKETKAKKPAKKE